ncbi:MAG: MBOAT family protein [Planctomycetales bacterium]|nr:MBOAT family protein [Planctomycetales bacterium]
MVFNSFTFAVFFAVVVALHSLPLPWRVRKFNLLCASYLFYAAWNPPFVILLWVSTLADWFFSRAIHAQSVERRRRAFVAGSLAVNLGLLGFFKYGGFVLDNFVALAGLVGIEFHPAAPDIILPVGISFYTFQTLSYTLDVYRRQTAPWQSFLDYALYVTFFPQLVAGPIVRAVEFLPQCVQPVRATAGQLSWGLSLMVIGLFEKMVCADGIFAPIVEKAYETTLAPNMVSAWCGTLAFAGQVFCDFAGYSTCAIGAAMCLGFRIPDNFRFPYAAIGFSDFWSRWHISLSTWLRDYLFIPLGSSRGGSFRSGVNLMVTMLLGGLWHGAAWTYVAWGGLHGLFLVSERIWKARFGALKPGPRPLRDFAYAQATFIAVCFTYVFFRAEGFGQAIHFCSAMLGAPAASAQHCFTSMQMLAGFAGIGVMLAIHWLMRNTTLEHATARLPWWIRSLVLAGMIVAIFLMPGEDRAFIYFQF